LRKIGVRQVTTIAVVSVTWLLTACDPRYGFMESRFRLADESRLPKWFAASGTYPRNDVRVVITLYTHPVFENKVRIVLYGPPPEEKQLDEKIGTRRRLPTKQEELEKKNVAVYPSQMIITVDGIDEIFEHRNKGDVLYIVDG
jgi:hypothetical protein